jgi:probable poly-beta-1,6-N-acetyl-D-glucosamine export protein
MKDELEYKNYKEPFNPLASSSAYFMSNMLQCTQVTSQRSRHSLTATTEAATATGSKKKSLPKLFELDIVRAFAILAVVMIHATAEATVELPVGSGGQAFYFMINKLSNFAVPVFILLSGVVLFYRYSQDWSGRQAGLFYLRRVKQVVVPYLIWSLFYYLHNKWVYERDQFYFSWREYVDVLPWADASYHLYFMVIIVQFYLLFPLLMTLCNALPWFRKGLLFIGLLIQVIFYSYHHFVQPVEHAASLSVNYFTVFAVGGQIGLYYESFIRWLNKHKVWVVLGMVVIGAAFVGSMMLEARTNIVLEGTWYELLFHSYAIFAAMSMIWIGRLLLERSKGLAGLFTKLGAASFGIYLVHPAVLTYWHTEVDRGSGNMLYYHAYTLGAFLVTLLVPWVLVVLYGRAAGAWRKRGKTAAAGRA